MLISLFYVEVHQFQAYLLRQHKERLEQRSRILEEQNRQLETQLARLRTIIAQVSCPPSRHEVTLIHNANCFFFEFPEFSFSLHFFLINSNKMAERLCAVKVNESFTFV